MDRNRHDKNEFYIFFSNANKLAKKKPLWLEEIIFAWQKKQSNNLIQSKQSQSIIWKAREMQHALGR